MDVDLSLVTSAPVVLLVSLSDRRTLEPVLHDVRLGLLQRPVTLRLRLQLALGILLLVALGVESLHVLVLVDVLVTVDVIFEPPGLTAVVVAELAVRLTPGGNFSVNVEL